MRLQGNIARQRRDAARRFVLRQATGAQRDSACAPGPQLPPELRAQLALSGRRPSARAPGLKPPPQSWVSRAVRQPLPAADLRAAATSNASSPLPERKGIGLQQRFCFVFFLLNRSVRQRTLSVSLSLAGFVYYFSNACTPPLVVWFLDKEARSAIEFSYLRQSLRRFLQTGQSKCNQVQLLTGQFERDGCRTKKKDCSFCGCEPGRRRRRQQIRATNSGNITKGVSSYTVTLLIK